MRPTGIYFKVFIELFSWIHHISLAGFLGSLNLLRTDNYVLYIT